MEGYCVACKDFLLRSRREYWSGLKSETWHEDIFMFKAAAEEVPPEKRCPLCRLVWCGLTAAEKKQIGMDESRAEEGGLLTPGKIIARPWTRERLYGVRYIEFSFLLMQTAAIPELGDPTGWSTIFTKKLCIDSIKNMALAKPKELFNEFRPETNTGSKWCLDLALQWVENCIHTHKLCKTRTSSKEYLPTRLIYTGQSSSTSVHLCQTKYLKLDIRYITLSHCWGQAHEQIETCNLKYGNEAAMLLNIDVSGLPRTFQDAIFLAREFGIGYLWIDSLCIIQDSESDWRHESSMMADIYSNAFCNIAAVGAADSPDDTPAGLFFDREVGDLHVPILEKPTHQRHEKDIESTMAVPKAEFHLIPPDGKYRLFDNHMWSREINSSCLARRAWVLQERLLPKRVIHFAKRQLFFECRMSQACETYPYGFNEGAISSSIDTDIKNDFGRQQDLVRNAKIQRTIVPLLNTWTSIVNAYSRFAVNFESGKMSGLPRAARKSKARFKPSRKRTIDAPLNTWARIVEAYSRCALTFERDKLIALSGIARELKAWFKRSSMAGNQKYLAGLWAEGLYEQLLWKTAGIVRRPSLYVAPTWSWSSVIGPVNPVYFRGRSQSPEEKYRRSCTILGARVTTVDSDEMGLVLEGYIRMSGKLIPVGEISRSSDNSFEAILPTRNSQQSATIFPDVPEELEASKCYFIPMLPEWRYDPPDDTGLVVKSVPQSRGVFNRVGTFEFSSWNSGHDWDLYEKAGIEERKMITEDLYEAYNEKNDLYTFTIV